MTQDDEKHGDGSHRRELTALGRKIKAYIVEHPGLDVEAIAGQFGNTGAAYQAIQHLVWNQWVNINTSTYQLH